MVPTIKQHDAGLPLQMLLYCSQAVQSQMQVLCSLNALNLTWQVQLEV